MKAENIIKGSTEDEVWQQLNAQIAAESDLLEFTALIEQADKKILLSIDIDLGGGFESGYESTTISAPLHTSPSFKFALHAQHFTDEIGKFFGMQDEEIGYEDFDKKFVIKTNDAALVKELFADPAARSVFLTMDDFTFGIHSHHVDTDRKGPFLELLIEEGITDPARLRQLYHAFFSVLSVVDSPGVANIS